MQSPIHPILFRSSTIQKGFMVLLDDKATNLGYAYVVDFCFRMSDSNLPLFIHLKRSTIEKSILMLLNSLSIKFNLRCTCEGSFAFFYFFSMLRGLSEVLEPFLEACTQKYLKYRRKQQTRQNRIVWHARVVFLKWKMVSKMESPAEIYCHLSLMMMVKRRSF